VVNLNLATADHVVDTCGLVDIKFTDLTATVTAQPVGELMTDEAIQKILLQQDMGTDGRRRGQSMKSATPQQLWIKIDGPDGVLDIKMPSTSVSAGSANYGTTVMRNGDLTWQGLRTFSSGVRQPLFTLEYP
jgi:hypothetical protein